MLAPLKGIMEVSIRLFRKLKKQPKEKQLAQMIQISSNMLMLHAQDLLDQRIIENGGFVPRFTHSSVSDAINEIVNLVKLTVNQSQLKIKYVT